MKLAQPRSRADKQRSLADGESGIDAHAVEVGLLLADHDRTPGGQLGHRRPALPVRSDVLALVVTDVATRRWSIGSGVLDAARGTDPGRHDPVSPGAAAG
ncbi:MAG: hypothetical protein ACRDYZ_03240 [Acidimicrobiales bacterium]